jgi:hypothetical protein
MQRQMREMTEIIQSRLSDIRQQLTSLEQENEDVSVQLRSAQKWQTNTVGPAIQPT